MSIGERSNRVPFTRGAGQGGSIWRVVMRGAYWKRLFRHCSLTFFLGDIDDCRYGLGTVKGQLESRVG